MKYVVTIEGRSSEVVVLARDDGTYDVRTGGETMRADLHRVGGESLFSLLIGGKSCEVSATHDERHWRLTLRGATVTAEVESEQERNARLIQVATGGRKPAVIKANMPGFITKVLVRAGDAVQRGTPLLIIEAMKMENEIRAEHAGVVGEVLVTERQTVNNGDLLIRIGE